MSERCSRSLCKKVRPSTTPFSSARSVSSLARYVPELCACYSSRRPEDHWAASSIRWRMDQPTATFSTMPTWCWKGQREGPWTCPKETTRLRWKSKRRSKGKNVMGSKPLSIGRSGITADGATNMAISIRHVHSYTHTVSASVRCPLNMRTLFW